MAKLQLKIQDRDLEEISITKSQITIGREASNDVVLDHLTVSRQHIRVFQVHDLYYVEDLGSGNGTLLNDVPVTRTVLSDRDEIRVGNFTLIFLSETPLPMTWDHDSDASYGDKTFILPKNRPEVMAWRSEMQTAVMEEDIDARGYFIVSGGALGQEQINLNKEITVAGTAASADIRLKGLFIGRQAFEIRKEPKQFVMISTGGMRKARINGAVVTEPSVLKNDDIITIGALTLTFYCDPNG